MKKLLLLVAFLVAFQFFGHAQSAPIFKGRGLNVHGELLPVADLKAIDIEWVRGEFEDSNFSKEYVQKWRAHYKDFKQLVILLQWKQGPAEARQLVSWGVAELEVGNEPELSQWTGAAWTPDIYSKWFKSVDQAVGRRARLYGPSNGTWNPAYVSACIKLGCNFDGGITFHGYWDTIPNVEGRFWEGKGRWPGRNLLCTEIGFDADWIASFKGQYPKVKAPADSFLEMRNKLGTFPACFYDGPNGLFSWDGTGWTKKTPVYDAIRSGKPSPAKAAVKTHPLDALIEIARQVLDAVNDDEWPLENKGSDYEMRIMFNTWQLDQAREALIKWDADNPATLSPQTRPYFKSSRSRR